MFFPIKRIQVIEKVTKNPAHITTQVGLEGSGEGSKSFSEERKTKDGVLQKGVRNKMVPDFSTATTDTRINIFKILGDKLLPHEFYTQPNYYIYSLENFTSLVFLLRKQFKDVFHQNRGEKPRKMKT